MLIQLSKKLSTINFFVRRFLHDFKVVVNDGNQQRLWCGVRCKRQFFSWLNQQQVGRQL